VHSVMDEQALIAPVDSGPYTSVLVGSVCSRQRRFSGAGQTLLTLSPCGT
jgi:hypothetical protein